MAVTKLPIITFIQVQGSEFIGLLLFTFLFFGPLKGSLLPYFRFSIKNREIKAILADFCNDKYNALLISVSTEK
jgi:hypothetical protein